MTTEENIQVEPEVTERLVTETSKGGNQVVGQELLQDFDMRIQVMKAALKAIPAMCHQRNIVNMGGNPFIDDDGCQKIARAAGITFEKPDVNQGWETDPDTGKKYYYVHIDGYASVMGQQIYETGGCTSEDDFLSARGLPFSKLQLEIRKKANSNWQGRCVRRLLGLRELQWEELEQLGFDRNKANKIDYNSGTKSGKSKDTDDTRKNIGNACLEACADLDNPEAAAKDVLELITTFEGKNGNVPGKRSAKELSDKQANFTWKKIKEKDSVWLESVKMVRQNYALADEAEGM